MSGDVQPRKRKDKRKKKDDEEILQHHGINGGSDEIIHVHKESKLGGNICSKIIFFGLLGALVVMVGLIMIEYHGTSDVESQSAHDSPWSVMLEGWVDKPGTGHDDHGEEDLAHSEEGHDQEDHDEHSKEHDQQAEGENSEVEHEYEGETEDEVEDESFIQKTYEDLRAAYNQVSPEDSDVEPAKDIDTKAEEDVVSESEPEQTETEEEDEEEGEVQEDDPLGQWKSASGPEILAGVVQEVQSQSETEEEEEEESGDEVPVTNAQRGAQSNENEEAYEFADITNEGDWEIREELDEADRVLEEGDSPT